MSLNLSRNDLNVLMTQQKALLNERLDDDLRLRGILVALRRLIGAKRAFAAHFLGGDVHFISDGVGDQIQTYFATVFRGFDKDGNIMMSDPELAEINRRRRQMGAGVHHESRLQNREIIENTTYFKEAFAPAGMHHVVGLTTPLPVAEAIFAFGFEGADDPGFSGDRAEHLLGLVLPAFEAGFKRSFLAAKAEQTVSEILKSWPETRLETNPMAAESFEGVSLPGPSLPDADETWFLLDGTAVLDKRTLSVIAEDYGLTPRQIEVMTHMLDGLSSAEIAEQLGISVNTARRHCEAVLRQLRVHSRAAIWTALSKRPDRS